MGNIGFGEALWVAFIALLQFGIPILCLIWIIRSITDMKRKLDAIERRLNNPERRSM